MSSKLVSPVMEGNTLVRDSTLFKCVTKRKNIIIEGGFYGESKFI